jgi:uncharacterized membrane protein YczE
MREPPGQLRRTDLSGILLIIGLVIEAVSLIWAHPTAFWVFAFIGCAFIGLGMLIFLYSLVSADSDDQLDNH